MPRGRARRARRVTPPGWRSAGTRRAPPRRRPGDRALRLAWGYWLPLPWRPGDASILTPGARRRWTWREDLAPLPGEPGERRRPRAHRGAAGAGRVRRRARPDARQPGGGGRAHRLAARGGARRRGGRRGAVRARLLPGRGDGAAA